MAWWPSSLAAVLVLSRSKWSEQKWQKTLGFQTQWSEAWSEGNSWDFYMAVITSWNGLSVCGQAHGGLSLLWYNLSWWKPCEAKATDCESSAGVETGSKSGVAEPLEQQVQGAWHLEASMLGKGLGRSAPRVKSQAGSRQRADITWGHS